MNRVREMLALEYEYLKTIPKECDESQCFKVKLKGHWIRHRNMLRKTMRSLPRHTLS